MSQRESETIRSHAQNFIPLARAYLCQDCDSVGANAMRCPFCASEALLGLAKVIDRGKNTKASNLLQFSELAA